MAESRTLVLIGVAGVLVLLVGIAVGYILSPESTTTSVVTMTITSAGETIQTTHSYTCEVSGPPIGAFVHLINASCFPVSGVNVSGIAVGHCDNERQLHQMSNITNSSGWANFKDEVFGTYYLSFTYEGQFFNFTVPTQPTTLTIATLYLFGGNLTIQYCIYGDMTRCSSY